MIEVGVGSPPLVLTVIIENAGELFGIDGVIPGSCVGIIGDTVVALGDLGGFDTRSAVRLDARGGLVTGGLVDAHTHLVFAGDRADEHALRARGATYLEIAERGGGIASTMRQTRACPVEVLVLEATRRLDRLLLGGVTTTEIKSGYGLDAQSELKLLHAIKHLSETHPMEIVPTFLGAHTIPPEHRSNRTRYVDLVVEEMLPEVAEGRLARFCDVFVERGAFEPQEAVRILGRARSLGLGVKLHVDQLTAGGGAELAAHLGATSADHLEHVSPAGITALARAGTVAVLLPGAGLFLGEDVRPPARALLDAGVPVAIATDCNPGTCPSTNLGLMMTLAVSRLHMQPDEALRAVTSSAARALDLPPRLAGLTIGAQADVAIFGVPTHRHLPYAFGADVTRAVVKRGKILFEREPCPSFSSLTTR